jgi:hypothetical protein
MARKNTNIKVAKTDRTNPTADIARAALVQSIFDIRMMILYPY